MALLLLSWQIPGQAQLKQLYLDASLSEQHVVSAQVTEHQVETGVNITDHIRPMPKSVTLEGVVTNTPLGSPSTYGVSMAETSFQARPIGGPFAASSPPVNFKALAASGGDVDRVKAVYPDLVAACLNAYLFTIASSLAVYENMAATNLSVPRSVAEAHHLHFTIAFQEVRIVSSSTATVNVPPKIAKGTTKPQTPKTNTDEQKESLASKAGVGRLLGVQ